MFCDKLVEESATDTDYVWIHDYHLLVLPSLLRKRFNRIRCGVFLHSPFPSSEIFRTFPKREELLRSMLNADLIGEHFAFMQHAQRSKHISVTLFILSPAAHLSIDWFNGEFDHNILMWHMLRRCRQQAGLLFAHGERWSAEAPKRLF